MHQKYIFPWVILLILFSHSLSAQSLLIFGGSDHKVFLGCLNSNKYSTSSIWNSYGSFGSKYNNTCIWNNYGNFGGKYSDYSPFNPYATHPPVLVDNDGNFYGYFTANKYFSKRTDIKLALFITDYWESIAEDPGKYYDKIFSN